ncbi:hypothetical protein EC9_31600 [Rosistilla ulvae]|uniref:Uncharacterized protein n=1 Tax=Rosistilla ulvae TaxID=1930277 RepID=A0A517M259_9BACT|nr:hypothetical protein EC9_31600 [Rosistilla ulvae]
MGLAFRRCAAARRPPATLYHPFGISSGRTLSSWHPVDRDAGAPVSDIVDRNAGAMVPDIGPKARRFALPRPTAWDPMTRENRKGQRPGNLLAKRSAPRKLPGRWPYGFHLAITPPRPLAWAKQMAGASPRKTNAKRAGASARFHQDRPASCWLRIAFVAQDRLHRRGDVGVFVDSIDQVGVGLCKSLVFGEVAEDRLNFQKR